jgi:hypothetical protein
MLTFAVAVAEQGQRVPVAVTALLSEVTLDEVPFFARRHVLWSAPSGSVVFAGWQDTTEVEDPIGGRWHHGDGGLTAFTGHAWPRARAWYGGQPWAAQLAEFFRAQPLATGTDGLLGIFTAVSLDASGRGAIGGDALGLGLTYWGRAHGVMVFSSRASIVARAIATVCGSRPRRDAFGAGWLAFSVHPMGSRTGFEGVEALPSGATVRIDPSDGAFIERPSPRHWRFRVPPECDPHDLIGELYADIATAVRTAAAMPVDRHVLSLTGGKDSRLIFAVALADGLADHFEYRTSGSADLPDVVIAQEIARTFGLSHQVNVVDPLGQQWRARRSGVLRDRGIAPPPDRETLMRMTVGSHLGVRNVCEPQTSCPPHGDAVAVSGLTGELLRTQFAGSSRLRAVEDLDEFFHVDLRYGMAGILHPEVRQVYERELWQEVFHDLEPGDTPQDVVDVFYLRHRLRRWSGTAREVDELNQLFPLSSPVGVRAAFAMGTRDRRAEWFHHEITRRASKQLAHIPFAKSSWPKPAPAGAGSPSAVPPPLPPLREPAPFAAPNARPPARTTRHDQQMQNEATDIEIMRKYLVDDTSNPVHELVDRSRVAALLERFAELTDAAKRQMYGALSAAIWLGHADIAYRDEP